VTATGIVCATLVCRTESVAQCHVKTSDRRHHHLIRLIQVV